ncbi:MAG TPA: FtsX-like permease family protein [Gammaproteobacteria bacterium]|nr:FtsX-like permease family protein [Gammaproteobacteria bacterium]
MSLLKDILACLHPKRLSHTRTCLCLLGMMISACCITTLLQCTELSIYSTQKEWQQLTPHLHYVSLDSKKSFFNLKNYRSWYHQLDDKIVAMSPILQNHDRIKTLEKKPIQASIVGIDSPFIQLTNLTIVSGKPAQVDTPQSILIGFDLAKKHHPDPSKLVGQQWVIKGNIFTIAGILTKQHNSFISVDFNWSVLLNLEDYETLFPLPYVNQVLLQTPNGELKPIINPLSTYFDKPQFFITEPEKMIELSTLYQKQSARLMLAIGLVSLLMGGLGIMTMMFGMIAQRRREIGLRLTLGAKPHHIQILFLAEGSLYGSLASTVGCAVGYLIAWLIANNNQWEWVTFLSPGLYALMLGMSTCIIFSILPARKASLLQPIDTLRHR